MRVLTWFRGANFLILTPTGIWPKGIALVDSSDNFLGNLSKTGLNKLILGQKSPLVRLLLINFSIPSGLPQNKMRYPFGSCERQSQSSWHWIHMRARLRVTIKDLLTSANLKGHWRHIRRALNCTKRNVRPDWKPEKKLKNEGKREVSEKTWKHKLQMQVISKPVKTLQNLILIGRSSSFFRSSSLNLECFSIAHEGHTNYFHPEKAFCHVWFRDKLTARFPA